jgi:branched-chain amino acid transport system permease protein
VFILLALGLNIVVGYAGLLDLGYAAFFAIGAYTYAILASGHYNIHLAFWPLLIIAAVVAAVFGVILGAPTLRLRGDYLAIVTLGFGEIVPRVVLNIEPVTGGVNGLSGLDQPKLPGIGPFQEVVFGYNPVPYYYTIVLVIALSVILIRNLQFSRLGRAWQAIREDELAAASMGINTVTTKLLAFAMGATTAGLAGVFNASKLTIVSPEQFLFAVSFIVLAMIILGGMGNIWGVAAGAFIVYLIQVQGLKQLNKIVELLGIPLLKDINFTDYQFLLFGAALVLMMLFRPEGLFPSQRRRRELHIAEELAGPPDEELPEVVGALGETPGEEELFGEDAGPGAPGHDR